MTQQCPVIEPFAEGLPGGWSTRPLQRISAFITKGSTPTTYGFKWERSGVLFLRSECVSERGLDLSQSMFISEAAHAALRRSEAKSGDILMTITGNVGRAVRLSGVSEANLNQHIARIRVTAADADPEFIFQVLAQPTMRSYFESITTGQAYPQISLEQVRRAEVPFPPVEEQRAIASALSRVDALLAKLDQFIKKKRDLKQAAMQQLLTGRTRLAGFSNPWRLVSFAELFEVLRNASNSRAELSADGEVGYVHYGDIHLHPSAFFDARRDLVTFIARDKVKGAPFLRNGDLLMADASEDTGAIGKAVEVMGLNCMQVVGGLHTLVLRPEPGRLAKGFAGYLQFLPSVRAALVRAATGMSVYGISKSSVRAIETPLPGVDEQTAIASILSDIDAELAALEARREKTRLLKQAMAQALLTGRIRLTGAADTRPAPVY